MSSLPTIYVVVLVAYLLGVVALGLSFARRSRSPEGFTSASGRLHAWTVGLSLFGTYLSSNTFLGVRGSAFASNWNAFVFCYCQPKLAKGATFLSKDGMDSSANEPAWCSERMGAGVSSPQGGSVNAE